jgi:hypothetical protein
MAKIHDPEKSIKHRLDLWAREREARTLEFMTLDEIQLIIDALYRDLRIAVSQKPREAT